MDEKSLSQNKIVKELNESIFINQHAVIPVIHVLNEKQAIRNAAIVWQNHCDGVFLINHSGMPHGKLLEVSKAVTRKFPHMWVGVNFLDLSAEGAFKFFSDGKGGVLNGLWIDNAMVDENAKEQIFAEHIVNTRVVSGWQGIYFGGVAFKHQRSVKDVAKAARIASHYVDVVTTSGDATGKAPDVKKIKTMKEAIGNKPLAIASGITPENIHEYLDIADIFLVATGISKDFHNLDDERVKMLVDKVGPFKK